MNRLIHESSPYLKQHAHNPVDWYPWGDDAIRKAKEEDKPILVSIGYSACHWCHVMERESFEDLETAELMNREFVNIKIDREERPDLDHIYMDAVQAIAGNGGWPLNVFLTPEAKPFFGGTYFPPVSVRNHPSWKSVLEYISNAFRDKRAEIEEQANNLTNHIAGSGFGFIPPSEQDGFEERDTIEIFERLMQTADIYEGGFGPAPKFPQTFSLRFLLQYNYYFEEVKALNQACLSLDKMIYGGIYDQLAGGFARYSTDSAWLAPHFEKMLYDNALLITVMSEAYQIVRKNHYKRAICETVEFLTQEMRSAEGGFYSAIDADSEGEEGKFYVWQKKEVDNLLGADSGEFCQIFDITERGNWEGKNILQVKKPELLHEELEQESASHLLFKERLDRCKKKLLSEREKRPRPHLDDKILLGWNALIVTAFCKVYSALGDKKYQDLAVETINFLELKMKGKGIFHFYHCYKDGQATIPGFLDDYAYLIEAYINLQEITGNGDYLMRAEKLTDWVVQHFSEEDSGYFYYTHASQDDVIVRKREIYDGALPSGNSVMAFNLLYLGTVFDYPDWKVRAQKNVLGLKEVLKSYPGSFGVWATIANALTYQLYEIVLGGNETALKLPEFLTNYIPNRVFQCSSAPHENLPLLKNKPIKGKSAFFLCRDYTCQKPVSEVAELIPLLKNS